MRYVKLQYNGNYFGDKFEINEDGDIKNIHNDKISKTNINGLKYYSIIYYNKRTYRINIGEAQEESGLVRTVMDREPVKKPNKIFSEKEFVRMESRLALVEEQLLYLDKKFNEMQQLLDNHKTE